MNRRHFFKSCLVAAATVVLPSTLVAKIHKAFNFGGHTFNPFTQCCSKCGIGMDLAVGCAGYEECFGIQMPKVDMYLPSRDEVFADYYEKGSSSLHAILDTDDDGDLDKTPAYIARAIARDEQRKQRRLLQDS